MKNLVLGLLLAASTTLWSQVTSSELIVGLKDGTTLHPKTIKYKQPAFNKDHLLLDGEQKLEIDLISYYQDASGYYVWERVDGEKVRLKRESVGTVSTYSRMVNTYTPGMSMNGMMSAGTHSTSTLMYFQKENSTIKRVNYENLNASLKDNAISMNYLEKTRKIKGTNTAAYLIGGGLVLGGLAHMAKLNEQEGPPPYDIKIKVSPLLFLGAATLTIPLFTRNSKETGLMNAIKAYNN